MSQLHSLQGNLSENRYNMQFNFEHLLKELVAFSEKDSFLQKVGNEVFEKMIHPDRYYEKFCEDAHSLPWIPDN